jgi:hypothetical protein
MPFFTKPRWCVQKFKETDPEYEWCGFNRKFNKVANYMDLDSESEFLSLGVPSSSVPKFHPHTQAYFDIISFSCLLYFTLIRLFLKKTTTTAIIRSGVISACLLYLITASILTLATGYHDRYNKVVAFFILMGFIRSTREMWKRIFVVVYDSLAIMLIIVSYIVFMSILGYVFFTNLKYTDPNGFFEDIPTGIFSMIILFTTSNFPDILFPFWKRSNFLTFVFFLGYLLVGLYMLLNLMLAVFYNSYKNQIEKKIGKYDLVREEFLLKEF